jgi:hypothetical protein
MRPRQAMLKYKAHIEALEWREVLSGLGGGQPAILPPPRTPRTAVVRLSLEVAPTPLDQMLPGQAYQGLDGGLYGNWSNQPSQVLQDAAAAAAAAVRPLDLRGRPKAAGRIGLVAIGQSTTRQWFPGFQALVATHKDQVRRGLFLVSGAQDGMVSVNWARTDVPWGGLAAAVGAARAQVQVAFLDAALINGQSYGDTRAEAGAYARQLATIIERARGLFPNLRLVYVFPFHWAGSAGPTKVVTEPASYRSQFGIRRLILAQDLRGPIAVWGPNVWPQTQDPRLYYDGVHFTRYGRAKMTRATWAFLKADPNARWFWR